MLFNISELHFLVSRHQLFTSPLAIYILFQIPYFLSKLVKTWKVSKECLAKVDLHQLD
jgi:hypothetical protein